MVIGLNEIVNHIVFPIGYTAHIDSDRGEVGIYMGQTLLGLITRSEIEGHVINARLKEILGDDYTRGVGLSGAHKLYGFKSVY